MKKWLPYIKPYWRYFVIGPLCMIVEVIGEVLMPKLMSIVINQANNGTLTVSNSLWICVAMIAVALSMMAGGIGGAYFGAKASVYFASDIRRDVYRRIQRFSFRNIDRFSTGSLITRVTNDVTQLQNFVNMLLRMALRSPGMMIGAIIMSVSLQPKLSVVFTVSVPLMMAGIGLLISVGFPRFQKMQSSIDGLNTTVQENISNTRVIKSFLREDFENQKFARANAALKRAGLRAMRVVVFMQPLSCLLMNLTTVTVIWIGSRMVMGGGMPVGDLSAFVTYVTQILMSLMMLTMLFISSSRALASAKRIREVLDEEIDISDETAAFPDKQVKEGRVEFRHVTMRYYANSADPVLNDINLCIEPGSTVGIIGSTGCGKTTLVTLIPRLYDTDEGQVLVDGVDVRDYSLYHLREGVGMVLQKNVLFSGSIEDNLLWGDEQADEDSVRRAADLAQADGFINTFADGYQTMLSQGGSNVSGGQKQRLCIARALLKKPKILILDDSTSAVDTATEAKIRKALSHELKDSTKIIIAQRIGSVMEADQIVVMNEGTVTGIGTHEYLLANNEEYREIYESQIKTEERGQNNGQES